MDYSSFLRQSSVDAFLYTYLLTLLSENQRRSNEMLEEAEVSRGHQGNKLLRIWSTSEDYESRALVSGCHSVQVFWADASAP